MPSFQSALLFLGDVELGAKPCSMLSRYTTPVRRRNDSGAELSISPAPQSQILLTCTRNTPLRSRSEALHHGNAHPAHGANQETPPSNLPLSSFGKAQTPQRKTAYEAEHVAKKSANPVAIDPHAPVTSARCPQTGTPVAPLSHLKS